MCGRYTPTLFPGTPPPLSLYRKISGPQLHSKPPICALFHPISSGSANRVARHCRILVNRDAN